MSAKSKRIQLLGIIMTGVLLGLSGCADKEVKQPSRTQVPNTKVEEPKSQAPVEQETEPPVKADDVQANLDKLKDQSFVETTPEGATWYTAAENLGLIGKPAIPGLMEKLQSSDEYERTQALYALRLAAQHDNVREFTGGEFPNGSGEAFPQGQEHPELIKAWQAWFAKYKTHF